MKFKALFFILLSALTSKAQFAFDVFFNETDAYGSASQSQVVLNGYVKNTSGSSDVFIWQLTKGSMPAAWSIKVKDKIKTHDSTVTNSYFSLADNDSAEISIILNPAMTSGATELTLTVSRQSDPFDLVEVNLSFNVWPVSTSELTKKPVIVYPNPTINQLFIQLATEEDIVMKIYSVQGQELLTHYHSSAVSAIDIDALPAGAYMLRFTGADGIPVSRQFIKL